MIKKAVGTVILTVRKIYVLPIHFYRRFLSAGKGAASCRFTPTCSQYAVEAVMEWGIVIGTLLTLWRLIRCNPFSKGGKDPVPSCPFRIKRDDSSNNDN